MRALSGITTTTVILLAAAAFAVALPGCTSDQTQSPEGIGSVDMTVTLATPPSGPNEQIDTVNVSLFCEGIDPVLGVPRPAQSSPETFTINVSTSQGPEPYNTIGLFEKQGLPEGDCYFSFSAVSNTGNTECTGELTVAIVTNMTTSFEVVLACIHTPRYGGVRGDGSFNQCAEYRQILVTPTTQAIGNLIDVQTEVYDPDGDPVTVSVETAGACGNVATVGSDTAASCETVSGCEAVVNTVECTGVGLCEITVAVSDDGFTSCDGLLPDGSNNDAASSTIAVDCTAAQGLCAGVTCPDVGECVTGVCDPADGSCNPQNDGINTGCDLGPGPGVCDGAGACVQCNMDSQCASGEICVNNVCEGAGLVCEYEQDFEALDPAAPDALSNDGWLYFGSVFDGTGAFKFQFGPFPASTTTGQISLITSGQGGPDQGANQLVVFSNYDCCGPGTTNEGHFNGTDLVFTAVFQQINSILATDIGLTFTFQFDAKRGNIEGASSAQAFLRTLDPDAGFTITSNVELDVTDLPVDWGTYTVTLDLGDPLLEGQILQFGFQNTASNFEGSGNFYDNLTFGPQDCVGECAVDADCRDDGNECTAAVCSAGSCETSNVADGTACNNNTGTCNAGVCQPTGPIELRPLPEIYTTGTAINYGPYRAGGPGTGEMPSDAQILQDLGLLQTAGYNLIRLFGGDAVSEKILQLAQSNFPEMRFQQGLFLGGLAPGDDADNCQSPLNDSQVETAIQLANTYPTSVVTVSVGNETSFFSAFMPLNCLEGYITRTRNAVEQPVTANDDYTFYAGFTPGRSPDTVLRLIDFVSIHTYPFINYRDWDWEQEAVQAGPLRAEAMMNASLVRAQQNYQSVYDYTYLNAGTTVTVGDTLPIVIGETGWKWRQTNFSQEIETYAANPVNAKWYKDLMQSWERSPGGPVTVMDFVAFDEAWKGTDDGWGFWDELRQPNYALCGTPAGSACNNPVYQGAGFFTP